MIEDLSRAQLVRAMELVGELGQLRQLCDFPRTVVALLRSLIACDHASWNVIELQSGRATLVVDPPDTVWAGGAEHFARLGEQNAMLAHVARTGDRHAHLLSAFMSRRALHRTELYADVYRRIPMEYQLAMALRSPLPPSGHPPEVLGLSLGRIRRDFTEAERCLLQTLRPHLDSTLERLHERALLEATIAADPQHSSRWLLLVDNGGMVAWASPAAARDLGIEPGTALPTPLRCWITMDPAARNGGADLTLDGLPVRARLVRDAHPELDALHLSPVTEHVPAEKLRSLGLTRRQADVLELAIQGRTAAQIAEELALSRRTVEKHFDGIYTRLRASNRTQAIVAALQATAT